MKREECKNIAEAISFKIGERQRLSLPGVNELIDQIFNEHEAQLKAKDEFIKELECRAYHAEGYINDLHNSPNVKKFYDKKARSIVAMLFWEWRKSEARIYATNIKWKRGRAFQSQILFEAAYKILKEQQ